MLRDVELKSRIIHTPEGWKAYKSSFGCGSQCHNPEAPKSYPVLVISQRVEDVERQSWDSNMANHTFITPKELKDFLAAAP